MYVRYELEVTDDEDDEGFDLYRTKTRYSTILQEEDYEDEEEPKGFDPSPEDNYDVETWDPREPSYFFLLK